jgi:rhamnosyl/mannosyltransferase
MPVSLGFPFLLRRLSRHVDILHFHMPFPLGVLSYLAARPRGKVVVWWHSDIVRQKKIMPFYRPLLHRFLRTADRIIVATSEHIENSPHLRDFRGKCEIVPFGIDTSRFELNSEMRAKEQEIRSTHGPNIVLFVGRLIYYKGAEYLIRAMKDVDGRLLIIGKGPLENQLRSQAADLGIEDKVVFLGSTQEHDMAAYYHSCDVFVLPSIARSEAFGIVQLEAMACGKPVINTDLPTGVPGVSRNGETGITVPPADPVALSEAINKLLRDSDFRQSCGSNARRRVKEHFSMSRMIDNVYQVYQEVLA